jgi:MSHA biogenesis protein MshN
VAAVVTIPVPAPQPEASVPIAVATTSVQTDGAPPTIPGTAPPVKVPAPIVPTPAPAVKQSAPPMPAPASAVKVLPPPVNVPAPTATARPRTAQPQTRPQAVAPVPGQPLPTISRSGPEKVPGAEKPKPGASSPAVSRPAQGAATVAAVGPQAVPLARVVASQMPAVGSVSGATISPSPQPQRQTSAQETLAHAQALWAAGSHEAALDLMREAVAVAERSYQSGTLAAGSPVLASLVRELARMELAEGRVSRVLEMLTRLEPALTGQADLWAVRGNAAQRLARHQESVQAYFQALELRPEEPRWMLGAAVSLAALGRLQEAAVQAEKARAIATVSPEILTYLRQAGVPLK